MDYRDKIISDISTVVANLTLKIETLQAKVNELCRSTGDCPRVKKVNSDLTPTETTAEETKS